MAAPTQVDISDASEPTGDRRLGPRLKGAATAIAVAFTLFHLYTAGFGSFSSLVQRSVHVGFALTLVFILYSSRGKGGSRVAVVDWMMVALSIAGTAWVVLNFDRFMSRQGLTTVDLGLGVATLVAVLEAARRVIGVTFTLLALAFLAYAFLGPHVPMPFAHRGFSLSVIVNHLYTSDLGLWGTTTGVTATIVAIFIIFGSVLLHTGGAQTFMNVALLVAGRSVGGPAKVATIASSLFGTISGSAVANVAVTGSFTIPMMKRLDYDRAFAGGVEATASTGGQLMPPIMGAGAFIMAELIGVPYVDVVLAAAIPAYLFYLGVFAAIHFGSKRRGYRGLAPEDLPGWRTTFAPMSILPVVASIGVILYFLMTGSSAQFAGFAGTLAAAGLFVFKDLDSRAMGRRLRVLLRAFEEAGYALVLIAVLAATAQILIGIIGLSGIGVRFTGILIAISAGELAFALVIAMFVALVLGMGMPTTGAYLVAASVLAPALIRLDVEPIAAHLFIFYFAIISAITPPVCAAVFVASGIAKSNWVKTAFVATRLGLVAFLIPFLFVYSPALLMQADTTTVLVTVATATIGVLALAAGVMGFGRRRLSPAESGLLIVGSLLMVHPGHVTDIAGLVLIGLGTAVQVLRPHANGVTT